VINSDDVKLLQTLNNLLSNAVKWSPNGSTIDTAVAEEDYQVTITVQDHGIGIPEKLQSVIFQKNTPASRPGLSGEKSIGMGLYIAKKLVELLNGKISFESKEHEGSVFTITLPKHPVSNLNGNSSRYSQGDAS
jgi:two-component system, OmpR family, sensor histidine kinase VicK